MPADHPPLSVSWFVPPAVHLAAVALGLVPHSDVGASRATSSDEQFEALVAGRCDGVVTAMDNVFAWQRRPGGEPLRIIAQVERTTPLTVVARPGLASLRDLRGARVLVDAAGNGFVVALLALLDEVGIAASSVDLVTSGGVTERLQALLESRGDATLLGPPFDEMAQREGMVAVATVQAREPAFPGQGLVMRRDDADARERVARCLRAWSATLLREPDDVSRALAATGVEQALAASMQRALPKTLQPDPDGIEVLVRHRVRLGMPGADDTYNSLVDASMVDELEG